MAEPYEDDLAYLHAETEWVLARDERLALGKAPDDKTEEGDEDGKRAHRRASVLRKERRLRRTIDQRLAAGRRCGVRPSLDVLAEHCELDDFERLVLVLAIASALTLDASKRRGSWRPGPVPLTVQQCFEMAEFDFGERVRHRSAFLQKSPLVALDLVVVNHGCSSSPRELLEAEVELTATAFARVCGRPELGDELTELTTMEAPRATMAQVVLPEVDRRRLLSVVDRQDELLARRAAWGLDEVVRYGRGIGMLFYGPPGTGKTLTAHAVADRLGKRVMQVDIRALVESYERQRFLPALFREARLGNAILFFDECERLFEDRQRGGPLTPLLLTELERFDGMVVLATNRPQDLDPAVVRRLLVRIHFDKPDAEGRAALWSVHLPEALPLDADVDLGRLAERFELTGGLVKNAVLCAVAEAVHADESEARVRMAHLEEAARQQLRSPVADGSKLVEPRAAMADLVVHPELRRRLDELVAAARDRHVVLDRWGLGRRLTHARGIAALLHGPPGTGKTLCAEAVAFELGRPLCVLGAADVLSMWVGEAEKNLTAAFAEARSADAVVLLDEADWLFSQRGSPRTAHHQDQLVNTALTTIEQHPGVVLLATNLRDSLDPGLARRMMYHLRFDLPDARARSAIWRAHLPDTVPTREPLDFERLGARYEMSGGLIRNAAFKAAFRAARLEEPLTQLAVETAAREVCQEVPIERKGPIGYAGGTR